MAPKLPPVPSENQPPEGPGDQRPESDTTVEKPEDRNLREQGRQGDIHQNTHHQGYRQDR